MALDFLLLQRYPEAAAPRFRHYEWRGPAVTFGFGQKIAFVREQLPALAGAEGAGQLDWCRRPTGGGIVDHRNDWTYALVIPRGHPLEEARATESYRAVHAGIAAALVALGQPAELKAVCEPPPDGAACAPGPGVCFQRAELHDVVHARTGAKIAGAAQKRNKHGLLFQGSIEKGSVGPLDWDEFAKRVVVEFGRTLGVDPLVTPWPEFPEHEVEGLIEQYSTPEWIEYR